jgi:hypothetical protein
MQTRNQSFLACANKKQNVEINSPTSSTGQGKYMKYVTLPWPLLNAALSVLNGSFLLKNNFLRRN